MSAARNRQVIIRLVRDGVRLQGVENLSRTSQLALLGRVGVFLILPSGTPSFAARSTWNRSEFVSCCPSALTTFSRPAEGAFSSWMILPLPRTGSSTAAGYSSTKIRLSAATSRAAMRCSQRLGFHHTRRRQERPTCVPRVSASPRASVAGMAGLVNRPARPMLTVGNCQKPGISQGYG